MSLKQILKSLILPSLFIGCVVCLILIFIQPQYSKLQSAQTEIKKQHRAYLEAQAKNDSLLEASKHSAEIEAKSDTVDNLWPDNVDVSKFIVQMEELAKSKGVILDSISVFESETATKTTKKSDDEESGKTKSSSKSKTIAGTRFSFGAKGSYDQIFNFIASLEKLARFNTESSVMVDSNDAGDINTRISGSIYAK